eukprot:CCRYP_018997-RA/>CCRYP_018997-RA protein AED:0.04 eAED:0.04 QI:373/1/1/1/0.62/0.44/9/2479/759
MNLRLLLGSPLLLSTTNGLIETPPENDSLASFAFVHPHLHPTVTDGETPDGYPSFTPQTQNLLGPDILPTAFQDSLTEFEDSLNLVPGTTQIDYLSGRIECLTLSVPILPGGGDGNRLLWRVSTGAEDELRDRSSAQERTLTSPSNADEWAELATSALQGWMSAHASLLEIDTDELFEPETVRTAVHGNGDTIQLHIPRTYKGITVSGSRAMATIKLGNLINLGLEQWGTIADDFDVQPQTSLEDAYDALKIYTGTALNERVGAKCTPELQIATFYSSGKANFGEGYDYKLVWRVCPTFEGQGVEIMEGIVDAQSGEIYSFVDKVHYFEAKGGVYPISNDNVGFDGMAHVGWPMPYMAVGNEITDGGGNYFNDGSVSGTFNGPYVRIKDVCGSASLSGYDGLDWSTSGGDDCKTPGSGNRGNTHSSRTNWYHLNKVIEAARSRLPDNSWLKQRLSVKVNINMSCNAFMNADGLNFYRSGNGCANTGELTGVIVHEWGHGLDYYDLTNSIASPSGEGIADIYSALYMADSCVGRGFFGAGSGCTGVRDIDYQKTGGTPRTFSWSRKNCGNKVHCTGLVYSDAVWSLYKRILQEAPYNYDGNTALEIVTRLTYIAAGNIDTWYSGSPPFGGCNSASGYRQYLAADDDNGNINDGTPHMQAIFKAFNDQEIACNTPAVRDSGCWGTPDAAPQLTILSRNMKAEISWTAVLGASNYQIFRTEGVKGCEHGKALVATTGALFFYRYRVNEWARILLHCYSKRSE